MDKFIDAITNIGMIVIATAVTAIIIGIALMIVGWVWLGVDSVWNMIF